MRRIIVHFTYFLLVVGLLYPTGASSQELSDEELYKISFDSLTQIEFELDYGTPYLKRVLDAHTRKAKAQNDTIELFNAYTESAWNSPFKEGLLFCDSMMHVVQSLNDLKRISGTHYVKGVLYYENNYPELAVEELIKSYDYAREADHPEYEVDALNLISVLKSEYGEQEEAILLQNFSLELLNANKERIKYFDETYLITLDNIARCHLRVENIDLARRYTKEGMKLALNIGDQDVFEELSVLDAQINYYDKKYEKARDTLLKYRDASDGIPKADLLYYLGSLEEKFGNSELQIQYFNQIDSILDIENYPLIDNVKEVYQTLLKDALHENEDNLEQKHLNRLLYYDSLLARTEEKIRNVTLQKFDIPFQAEKEKKAEIALLKKENALRILYIVTALICLGFIVFYFRYHKMKRLVNKIVREEVKPISKSDDLKPSEININEEVVRDTLSKLNQWEVDKGFLDKNIDQNKLARLLDTNSTYLSRIINTYKNQNFSNYLKDLRVTYAINYVKKNPQIIKSKSMIQLAEQFGFNSIDVFVRAFKAKAGITPSMFFKHLKRSNL